MSALAAGTAAAAALAIAGAPWALGVPALVFVFKPLATIGVIVYALGRGHDRPDRRRWVVVGLVLSLIGDVALLWPERGFLPGLIAFGLAHAAYLLAFTRGTGLSRLRVGPFAAYAVIAGGVLAALWPSVPAGLRVPVAVYVLALASMAAAAASLWRAGEPRGAVVAAGGALFVLSDALLATNRFASPLPAASLWILASYWAAQWCIASWLAPPAHAERAARAGATSP